MHACAFGPARQLRTCKLCTAAESGIVVGGEYGLTIALFKVRPRGQLGCNGSSTPIKQKGWTNAAGSVRYAWTPCY